MTRFLRELVDAIELTSRASSQAVHETAAQLRVSGTWNDQVTFERWRGFLRADLPTWIGVRIQDRDNNEIDLLSADLADLASQEFSVIIQKKHESGAYFFLTLDGFRNGLTDQSLVRNARRIFVYECFARFESRRCIFCSLKNDPTHISNGLAPSIQDVEVEAAQLTRYLTQDIVPPVISFWVAKEISQDNSSVWQVWRTRATQELLLFPATEVWQSESGLMLSLSGGSSGPRRRVLEFSRDENLQTGDIYEVLCKAAGWVIAVPREANIRHTYLAAELAREWPPNCSNWTTGFPSVLGAAIEGAQAHYEAHLLETSGEILKSLAELRKSVTAETQDAIKRTHDLTKALAASLAVSVGVILFRLPTLLDATASASDKQISQVVFGVLCGWMVFICSYFLVVNYNFRKALASSQKTWHSKIHAVLSSAEFHEMATKPLQKAERVYFWAATATTVVYIAAAVLLGTLAYDPFSDGPTMQSEQSMEHPLEGQGETD